MRSHHPGVLARDWLDEPAERIPPRLVRLEREGEPREVGTDCPVAEVIVGVADVTHEEDEGASRTFDWGTRVNSSNVSSLFCPKHEDVKARASEPEKWDRDD